MIEREPTEELPEGWVAARLADVTLPVQNVRPESEPEREFGYVDIGCISNDSYSIVEAKRFLGTDAPSRARRPIRGQDVLFSNVRTYLRNVAMVPEDTDADLCSTGFTVIRSNGGALPRYLFHYLLTDEFINRVSDLQTGSNYPAATDAVVTAQTLPIAPLAEQRRIVEKIDALLSRVNAATARLARVKEIVKRFRQSVLAAACSGRLTADWREVHPETEPASELLDRIRAERKAHWLYGRYRESVPSDADHDLELPEIWALTSMDSLCVHVTSGSRDWSQYYGSGSGTFILTQNVRPGRLDLGFRQPVDPPVGNKDAERSQVSPGDLLVTIVGANTGDVCPIEAELPEHYVCQSVAILRPVSASYTPFLNLWFSSIEHGRGQFDKYIYGAGRPHLSFDQLKMTPVALPSLEEQQEIVRRTDALLALADAIDARVSVASTRAEKLTQAVLAKAFRGELIPTEAELARVEGREYEPASMLLERVREEREAHTSPTRARPCGRRR